MSHVRTGLHISVVTLGSSHRICAIWSVRGTAAAEDPCEFPGALLLPRKGAEQDWALETALAAIRAYGAGDGPACVDLTTTADGIEPAGLRSGLCASDLLGLARTALGEGQQEWAELACEDPAAFHGTAAQPYTMRQQAACLVTRDRDSPRRNVRLLHARQDTVLRDYTVGLLPSAVTTDGTAGDETPPSHPRRQ
ncbi:hypothetical protein [Streptomyces antarcticus]|uniref:hypothetical protein n=1 Tax=Streptomyces antarcticus TaxID=2996458 RepID=UPI0022AF0245|nr:hypothetical protein [Streptomyces sp. H34-S5]MCZ4085688.1 hypothetical protein [Streptomyces sp. H34-S5]